MASCKECGSNVGCGCNLVGGMCISCYSKTQGDTPGTLAARKRQVRYTAPPKEAPPLTEFETILRTTGMSREEKLKRINQILEEARKKYL